MSVESLEQGPIQKGIGKERLKETLQVGMHKFVAEIRSDGSVGPLIISTIDLLESPFYPKHSELAQMCGLIPDECMGGNLEYNPDGTFTLCGFGAEVDQ